MTTIPKHNQPFPKTLVPFFWHFAKPHQLYLWGMAACGIYWGIHNAWSSYVLKVIIDQIGTCKSDKSAIFHVVQWPVFLYIILQISIAVAMRLLGWLQLRLFPNMRQDVSQGMFMYLNRHAHGYFQNNFAGSLANKIKDMAEGVVGIIDKFYMIFEQATALVIAVVIMYWVHPVFSIILMGWVAVFIFIAWIFFKPIHFYAHAFAVSKTTFMGRMVDSIGNIMNVRLFARHHYENTKITETLKTTVQKDRAMQWAILRMEIFWNVSVIVLFSLLFFYLIALYGKGLVTIGDFSLIIGIASSTFHHLWYVTSQFVVLVEQLGKCSQALSIITVPHEIADKPNAQPLVVKGGCIVFDKVTFFYHNKNEPLFQNISMAIAPGQKVGLVGFSGSGKSTFVNLILRFFDVQSGTILIDEQPITSVTQDSLHQKMAMIPQDTSLFHQTLMQNIRYGRLDATDEEVIAAAEQAHIYAAELPQGYQSVVGERGIKLSGGQRQRIAIARAILKNAPILILDEATSSLDSVTEKYIQDSLHTLMQGRTTIVIAHRLSTLAEMDRILVFKKGQIVEDGTHETLLKAKKHYAFLYATQVGGFLPDKNV